jgi:hypothetical protein
LPSVKEEADQKTRVRIIYLEETNHHDGYCSDAENEYSHCVKTHECEVPKTMMDGDKSALLDILPKPDVDGDSYFCSNGAGAELGMKTHDYRHTIIAVI